VLGLFSLRESWPLVLYATASVREGLESNTIFRTLRRFPEQVVFRELVLRRCLELDGGVTVEARPSPGKVPVHLMGLSAPSPEDNVGLWLNDARSGKTAVILGAAASLDGIIDELHGVDCVFFDGTFWSSDELIALGLSKARAEDMAHLPIGGVQGSLARLSELAIPQKIYTHINNSNPILVADSLEARAAHDAGWQIAYDGMEVDL
jgi:pyrroloquinoline quinone biosynthesis protein B